MLTDDSSPALIALWSAPRCRSTAFLRMMTQRGDRVVVHEPFSQLVDFGGIEVAGVRVTTEDDLMDRLLHLAERSPVFFKDTTDFRYPGLLARTDFLRATRHSFIIREPAAVVASHLRLNPDATAAEIGFARLAEIHARVDDLGGDPVVVDSDELVRRPDDVVRAYCAAIGIPFRSDALTWEPGRRPEWEATSRWHESTSASTGFGTTAPTAADGAAALAVLPDGTASRAADLVAANEGPYAALRARRLTTGPVAV